jgi:hypothetical protein
MATRDELHQFVSSLPDEALPAAHMALSQLQTWPPPLSAEVEDAARDMEHRLEQRVGRLRQRGSGGGGGIGFGSFGMDVGGGAPRPPRLRARHSTGYEQAGESVHESDIVHDDYEFVLVERISRDPSTDALIFTIELTGPDGTTQRHEHRYSR